MPITLSTSHQRFYEIKQSRFYSVIAPTADKACALEQIQHISAEHPHAQHLAFAWRIRRTDGQIDMRCHDAGEPKGTAGQPILAPLVGQNIINVIVMVVRYYGGIKLGTGGLSRAYGHAAQLAINAADYHPWVEMSTLSLSIAYGQQQALQYFLQQHQGQVLAQSFTDIVTLEICIPKKHMALLQQRFEHSR